MSQIQNATTATTATVAKKDWRRIATDKAAYLSHWIQLNSGHHDSAEIASLALEGQRIFFDWNNFHRKTTTELNMPKVSDMSALRFKVSCDVALSFGHLWSFFGYNKWENAVRLADHYNHGHEDRLFNHSQHPEPTFKDRSASGRYSWQVDERGTITMDICRPKGTAITIKGTIDDLENIKIKIDPNLCFTRHLECAVLQLQNIFSLSYDESLELIESSKGFSALGIRGGELANILRS